MQADPDEVAGFAGPLESFIEGYVGDSPAFGVYSGGNDSTHGSAVPSSDGWKHDAEIIAPGYLSLADG
ncbi:hypothetical protein D3C81_2129460 [compost metagenome]